MNVYRGLYFATLTGAIGGLLAALCALLASVPLAESTRLWLPDSLHLFFFGLIVASLLFVFFDRILLRRVRPSSIGYGLLFGGVAGVAAAALAIGLRAGIADASPVLYRLAVWALAFSVIGLGIGLRWVQSNRARVLHAYIGSIAGGLLSGVVFTLLSPHVAGGMSTVGMMLAGAGTGFGAGIAPILVREGVLRFVSSGDARAHHKLSGKPAWDLAIDETYVIGNASTAQSGTRFQQGADIWIPDSAMAARHAVVFSKDGRYFIARHPDAGGPEGIARYVLRIKGKTVVSSQELQPADDLMVGRTALRFEGRRQED